MKRKEFNDLRSKTIKDLSKMVSEKKLEAEKIKMKILGGKEKNLKVHKNLSREIAKILTLIREKEIIESLQPKNEDVKKGKENA
jgi:ribosomal protein L29